MSGISARRHPAGHVLLHVLTAGSGRERECAFDAPTVELHSRPPINSTLHHENVSDRRNGRLYAPTSVARMLKSAHQCSLTALTLRRATSRRLNPSLNFWVLRI